MKKYKSIFKENLFLNKLKNDIFDLYKRNKNIPEELLDTVYTSDDIYTDNVKNREYINFKDNQNRELRLVFNTKIVPHPLETIQLFQQDEYSYIPNEGNWINI